MSAIDLQKIRKGKILRKWDALIALVLILVSVFFFVLLFQPQGEFVEIYVKGELLYRAGLTSRYEGEFSGVRVAIENGKVFVRDSDCPDKLCVKTGAVFKAGSRVVCAPNAVVILITGGEYDAIIG